MSAWRSNKCAAVALTCLASWSANAAEAPGEQGAMHHEADSQLLNPGEANSDAASAGSDPNIDQRAPFGMAMHDDRPFFHILMEQMEYRDGQEAGIFQWEGLAWYGNDTHRLWLKSEGEISDGTFEQGQQEILYGRPITQYFDLQAGFRYDLDDNPGQAWIAFGVQGLAPNFFHVSATGYASDRGHFAANAEVSFDLLLSQRLILQPKAEIDIFTRNNTARSIGSGLSAFEGGLRLRYEITRKFAPYIGLAYERSFGNTRQFAISNGEDPETLQFVVGLRAWL